MKFKFPLFIIACILSINTVYAQNGNPKSDVYLQGFYWNSTPGGVWYDSLAKLAPRLASAGFSAVWFPSPCKGAGGGMSMGYDPYDHYDFGEYYQKGSIATRFGSRKQLTNAITTFHNLGMQVYADAVLRHMMGGEKQARYQCKPYPTHPDSSWLTFSYKFGSKRFTKDSSLFIPNSEHCTAPSVDPLFKFGDWLDHEKQSVRDSLKTWGKYLKNVLGFDGFRLDAVKVIGSDFMGDWLKNTNAGSYAVAEFWSNESDISNWLNGVKSKGASVAMFDFPLRYSLKDMCQNDSYDMNNLDNAGLVNKGVSGFDVSTFVENHDFDRIGYNDSTDSGHDPIVSNKHLAYAYTIFSEGRPCVFFKDYIKYGLGGRIDTLIWIRKSYISGGTTKRSGLNPWYIRQDGSTDQSSISKNIYVARRNGDATHPATYIVINNNPNQWIDIWVNGDANKTYRDYTGKDVDKKAASDGRVKLWAPAKGYTIYVADTSKKINFIPVLNKVPDIVAYTNSNVNYQLIFKDADDKNLQITLKNNPAWLKIDNNGILYGKPTDSDIAKTKVTVTLKDPKGALAIDSFYVDVRLNRAPKFSLIQKDTTVRCTRRFEKNYKATDADNDQITYKIEVAPSWLTIDAASGTLSGTPAIKDTTKTSFVKLSAYDGKGGLDTLKFKISVINIVVDTIKTYGKPAIDGNISISANDWKKEWQIAAESDTDSYWNSNKLDPTKRDNECTGIFATWDADSLYIAADYLIRKTTSIYKNSILMYIDAGIPGGITDFNSNTTYQGAYPRNFRFRKQDGIDFFFASWYFDKPTVYRDSSGWGKDFTSKIKSYRNQTEGKGFEASVAWKDIYGLGSGKIIPGAKIKFVEVVAGGDNWGAGDACPNSPNIKGTAGPDSLINFAVIEPDKNKDGIPDPTVIIVDNEKHDDYKSPKSYSLDQNYPNPFNPTTRISYQLPISAFTTVKIYNILGEEIATLFDGYQNSGRYTINFNASNLASGIYIYRLKSGNFTSTKKMMLIK